MHTNSHTRTNSFLIGVTAIVVQIVLIREFISVFYGNELVVGLILASWLLWFAVGSQIGNLLKVKKSSTPTFFVLQFLVVIVAIAAIFLCKLIRLIARVPIGEFVSIFDITWTSFAILAVPCFTLGLQFALLAIVVKSDKTIGDPSAHVYIFESLGSFIASLIFSLLVVVWLSNLQSLLLLFVVIGSVAAVEHRCKWLYICSFFFLMVLFSPLPRNIESKMVQLQWKNFNPDFGLVDWETSRYGQLAVVNWGGEKSLYFNGLKQSLVPDPIGTQQTTHLVMSQHRNPKSVLLIGGGMGGLAKEILKYDNVDLDYLELDEKVCSLMQRNLPPEDTMILKNPNLHIRHIDGRHYLHNTEKDYDIIIVNVGEPATASSNRYYTLEFFEDAELCLQANGIVALCNVPSAANYFGPEMLELNASIYQTMKQVFKHVLVIPGESAIFLGANDPTALSTDVSLLSARYVERGIQSNYFFKELFWQFLLPDRLTFVHENLTSVDSPIINRDFRPISYYFDLLLWNKIVRGHNQLLPSLGRLGFSHIVMAMILVFILYLLGTLLLFSPPSFLRSAWARVSALRHLAWRTNVVLLTAAVGFAGIVFSVVLILAFQTVFGYIYELVGLALAGFMAGLAAGSFLVNRKISILSNRKNTLPVLTAGVAGFAALLPLLLNLLLLWRSYVLFFSYLLFAGVLVGALFPVVCHEYHLITGTRRVGTIYAADLAGGCLGSLLSSAILVPILGLYQVCWLAAILVALATVSYIFIRFVSK